MNFPENGVAWRLLEGRVILEERSMEPSDITIKVLESIRDEVRLTRTDLSTRIEGLSTRMEETNERLGNLERLHVQAEVRVATELVAVSGAFDLMSENFRADRAVRQRLDDHERRIHAIEERAG